jgi:hypothetical protein
MALHPDEAFEALPTRETMTLKEVLEYDAHTLEIALKNFDESLVRYMHDPKESEGIPSLTSIMSKELRLLLETLYFMTKVRGPR